MSTNNAKTKADGAESASTAGLAGTQYIEYELLWQHDETGRMVWLDHPGPGDRWTLVPLMHEDELPEQNDAEYDAWYAVSRVIGGVRMGPLVTANAPHEGRTAALSPGVPLDAVVGGAVSPAPTFENGKD